MKWVNEVSWAWVILLCLTLGLAPFNPPHLWEKIQMLMHGELKKGIDWFDLILHAAPWGLLIVKAFVSSSKG